MPATFWRTWNLTMGLSTSACLILGLGGQVLVARLTAQPPNNRPVAESESRRDPRPVPQTRLFDGRTLNGWRIAREFDFTDHGRVHVQDGAIVLERGKPATGIAWTKAYPKMDYEICLQAKRVEGNDFFCGLTFPVGDEFCSLILGGWGGQIVGLSNINGLSAVENETTQAVAFQQDRWYDVRLRVTRKQITVWLNEKPLIELPTEGRRFSIWWEQEPMRPLGIATWYTTGSIRGLTLRPLDEE